MPAARRRSFNLVVPTSPDSGAKARGSPRDVGVTRLGDCQKSALSSPVAPPRQAVFEPPGTPSPGSSLAPSNPAPPKTIPFTVEAITFVSQGITYRTERTTLVARRVPNGPVPDPAERGIAAKVFELLTALDPENRLRKAPPIKVFLLRFRQDRSRSEIADICRCHKSLVALRLKSIREKLPWQSRQLRELSGHIEAMQDAVSDPRARKTYWKRAISSDEGDDAELD